MSGPRWIDDAMLRVDRLTMRFGGLTAVNDVSFSVGRGDITALIGPNGAGKTTLFNCLTGFYKPTVGRIGFSPDGRLEAARIEALTATGRKFARDGAVYLLERMADFEIAKRARVARTFQNIRLFAGMSVLENLIVAQHLALTPASGYGFFGLIGLPSYRRTGGRQSC
jgi:branched-chain amino acid transport system ATP-binding protein